MKQTIRLKKIVVFFEHHCQAVPELGEGAEHSRDTTK